MSVLSKNGRNALDNAFFLIGEILEQIEEGTPVEEVEDLQAMLDDASCSLFEVIEEDGAERNTDNED
jgi:hypothetical protein